MKYRIIIFILIILSPCIIDAIINRILFIQPILERNDMQKIFLNNVCCIIKENNKSKWLLLIPGNATCFAKNPELIDYFSTKYNVCAMDYRGYGESKNNATYTNTIEDLHKVWNYLISRTQNISICGISLDGAFATKLTYDVLKLNYKVDSLIIINSFASLKDMSKRILQYDLLVELFSIFTENILNTEKYLKYIKDKTKIIIYHANNDNIISISQSLKNVKACDYKCNYITYNGGHDTLPQNI